MSEYNPEIIREIWVSFNEEVVLSIPINDSIILLPAVVAIHIESD